MQNITRDTSQYTDNKEHDTTLGVKKVMPYGWTGAAAVAVSVNASGQLVVDLGSNNDVVLAAGTALIGKVGIDQVTANANEVVLKASTAAIGKLAANSGVDIGDVDVTSIANGSINGPAAPVIDSYTGAAISAVTGANQVLVSAPGASKQIWVYGYSFTVDTAGTTVAFQDDLDAAHDSYTEGFAQYGGVARAPSGNFAMPLFKVATNKALEVDVVGGTIGGSISYAIVSV